MMGEEVGQETGEGTRRGRKGANVEEEDNCKRVVEKKKRCKRKKPE